MESLAHLALRGGEDRGELLGAAHQADAATAAARRGLEHQRESYARRGLFALTERAQHVRAGKHRQAGARHGDTRLHFVAHLTIAAGGGPMNMMPTSLHTLGEAGVLGEEAVPGMDRLAAGQKRRADEVGDIEVALAAGGRGRCRCACRPVRTGRESRSASE